MQSRTPTPAEMDNFRLVNPKATDDDIQAFYEKDAERMGENNGWTNDMIGDMIHATNSVDILRH